MRKLIALDLGTSSIKAAVVELEAGRIRQVARLPFPEPAAGLPDLMCEIDVGEIVRATRQVIATLLSAAPECDGLVSCGQMGGLVMTDLLGAPKTNYISWRDQRLQMAHPAGGGSYWDHFERRLSPAHRRQLGNEVRPGLPVSFLYWLAERGQLSDAPVMACTLPEFVLAALCGAPPATDFTNGVGALNTETGDWHHTAFESLGLSHVAWPRLCTARDVVGTLSIDGRALTCFAPVGDHQAALAGAALAPGELSINISTGSQASLLTRELALGNYQTRPFFDGRYLNTITHIPAGRALNVLLGLLTELAGAQGAALDDPWPYIARAVAATPHTDLAVDPAFFPGPVGDRGSISNIREGNLSVGHLFRAAFIRMAESYLTCALRLSPDRAWEGIVFSGGLAQKLEVLRGLILEQFQCGHRLCASEEDTLLGLLAIGRVAAGQASTVQEAAASLAR